MRLIKGKDFYDSGLAFGQDDDLVFIRDGETFGYKEFDARFPNHPLYQDECSISFTRDGRVLPYNYGHSVFVLGGGEEIGFAENYVVFAGKKYNYLEVEYYNAFPMTKTMTRIWSQESLTHFLAEFGLRYKTNNRSRFVRRGDNITSPEKFFSPFTNDRLASFLIENKIATLTRFSSSLYRLDRDFRYRINGDDLKDLGLQKILNPYTAFQELSMWIGNLPRNANPMVEITDDKVKAAKHSMDKWSFRRTSSEKPNS